MEDLPLLYLDLKLKTKRKLRKYQHLLTKETDAVVTIESENLMICNAGLVSGNQREELVQFFSSFGAIEEVSMSPGKSYSFIKFKRTHDAIKAFKEVNGQKGLPSMDSCLYLLFVNKVPPLSVYEDVLPPGLLLLENFINEHEEEMLLNCVIWSSVDSDQEKCLKHRQVKHFGYEFRYSDNNVNKDAPLMESIPQECGFLFERLSKSRPELSLWMPDQLTVNKYEPGQGIPPHIDTHSAFNDPILSLSLNASIVMEWRNSERQHFSVLLPRRSLLIMSSESRYAWTHGITPRKTDILKNHEGNLTVCAREVRVSFTFRQLRREGPCMCQWPKFCDSQTPKTETQVDRLTEDCASKLEKIYVHQVYNEIASHFSDTRHKPWPNVLSFVMSLKPGDILLDVGCGNGKYFGHNKYIVEIGCDRSSNLMEVCTTRGFQVFQCDCLVLPLRSCTVNACISIAVIHHLSTQERRKAAINEIIRVLKPGGKALIYVWAKNQNKEEMSSYLKQDRKNRRKSAETSVNHTKFISLDESNYPKTAPDDQIRSFGVTLPVHSNRTNFQHNNLLVPWILKHGDSKNVEEAPTFLRFYHVFEEDELVQLCISIENCSVERSFYDQGNWCVILVKS
ncbi:unnamed protein product [Bemisia tabaci]|uniref:tRNA (carboxymethyluridine(34)-5-O)-methyltransferase n=1 Tax=Bemisia tabaci TaxID=7038 RepID=A0A9P0F2W7_BEMTA|nr:unnamed protein product [Bemisia tabaci]